jgi:hypothetical protein
MRRLVSPLDGIRSPFGPRFGTAFSPASLFAAGEQGVWYDPSDFTTMFQDVAGTTPVTAVEQPVRLLLDKSKGLALGPEIFSSFTSTGLWTVSGSTYSISSAASNTDLRVDFIGTVGKRYVISFTASGVSGSVLFYPLNTSPPSIVNGTNVTRELSNAGFFIIRATTGASATVSNISIRELPGNHATQSTNGAQPTLSARVNLLTKTEQFDDAVWVKNGTGTGTAPVVTANAGVAPDGTGTADQVVFNSGGGTTAADQSSITITATTVAVSHTSTIWMRTLSGTATVLFRGAAVSAYLEAAVTTTWQKFTITEVAAPGTGSRMEIGLRQSVPNVINSTATVLIWGADLRVTNDGVGIPAYQRVNTSTDYDTTGFPYYLRFDGTDDSMATGSINFTSTDKMSVFSGVRKLSDATIQTLYELSFDQNANTGTFTAAPGYSGIGSITGAFWSVSSKGTLISSATTSATFAAPQTVVQSHIVDISADSLILRLNSTQVASSASDQGPGNFGNYPLYIGSRGGSYLRINGRIYSLIVRGAQSTATEITNTETWVNGKTMAY